MLRVDQGVLQHVSSVASLSLAYTPQLLSDYMHLLCNAVRLHLLAQDMPRPLIVQLYTLLKSHVQVAIYCVSPQNGLYWTI